MAAQAQRAAGVVEATGVHHEALAEWLHEKGYRVCVLNPAQVAYYARSQLQRAKTDKVDAKLIASTASGIRMNCGTGSRSRGPSGG